MYQYSKFNNMKTCRKVWIKCIIRVNKNRTYANLAFVPKHEPCESETVSQLQRFIDHSRKLFVLTGAGISTESGIPDYRSEGVGVYATSNKRPVLMKDFLASALVRQSYWARNYHGWPRFSNLKSNENHFSLARWENYGKVDVVLTQNVDRLHHKAGSRNVIELHGSNFQVTCLSCSHIVTRESFQERLNSLNPNTSITSHPLRPDGDVKLSQEEVQEFRVPTCQQCRGNMKPYIVFFGDNVPKDRVKNTLSQLQACDSLLALGTSLHVYSSYRYILQAVEAKIPIAIVNIGPTRGDKHAQLKIGARCGEILPQIMV